MPSQGPDSPFASQPSIKPAVDYYRFRWPRNNRSRGDDSRRQRKGVSNCFIRIQGRIRADFAKLRGDRYLHFDDYIQYVPAIGYLGVGFIRERRSAEDFCRQAAVRRHCLHTYGRHNQRYKIFCKERSVPTRNTRNSFPSGHTYAANAFCGCGADAHRVRQHWVGLAGYAVAVTTGVMRMYNERHWWNDDVIAGAGIGILCARTAYWLLPLERKLYSDATAGYRASMSLSFVSTRAFEAGKRRETAFTAVPYYDASAEVPAWPSPPSFRAARPSPRSFV